MHAGDVSVRVLARVSLGALLAALAVNGTLLAEAPTLVTVRVANGDDDLCTDLACSVNSDDHSGFTLALPAAAPGETVELGPFEAPVDSDGFTTIQLRWRDPDFEQYHYSEPMRLHSVQLSTVFAFRVPPSSARRILIVAPHPDDETLATAGLIYHALHGDHNDHARVRVVIMTNGDAYTSATSNYYYGDTSHTPTALDFRNSGLARRAESLAAMALLGLSEQDVSLLNYPDQGLRVLFTNSYAVSSAWTSTYTRVNEKYDPNAFRRDADPASARFAGTNVHQDLVAIISEERPTEIYVSDPRDTHADHAYTYHFVDEALRATGSLHAALYRHIIHAPSPWPNPPFSGVREARCTPTLPFEPPGGMPVPDAVFDFAVMPQDSPIRRPDKTNLKRLAIDCYRSQIGWYYHNGVLVESSAIDSQGYLIAFSKSNELFWMRGYDGPDGNDWPDSPSVQLYDQTASGQLSRQSGAPAVQQDAHDVWRLAVPGVGRVRFEAHGSAIGLRLYHPDGVTLLAVFDEPGTPEHFDYVFRTPGDYFVEVFLQGAGSGGTYSFSNKTSSPPPPGDFDRDWDVDADDLALMRACTLGPAVPYGNPPLRASCTLSPDEQDFLPADFDRDGDLDHDDFGAFQGLCGRSPAN